MIHCLEQEPIRHAGEILLTPTLPHIKRLYPAGIHLFDPQLYLQNLEILQTCFRFHQLFSGDDSINFKRGVYPILDIEPDQAIQTIKAIEQSPNVDQVLATLTGEQRDHYPFNQPRVLDPYFALSLQHRTGSFCSISEAHSTDISLCRALKELDVDLEKTALVIVDRHLDVVNPKEQRLPLTDQKTNVINNLLDLGLGKILVVGLPYVPTMEYTRGVTPQFSGEFASLEQIAAQTADTKQELNKDAINRMTIHQEIVIPNQGRLIIPNDCFSPDHKKIWMWKLLNTLKIQMSEFSRQGIENILFMLDIDALDMVSEQISACEYNQFARLLTLGVQDFTTLLQSSGFRNANEFSQAVLEFQTNFRQFLEGTRLGQSMAKIEQAMSPLFFEHFVKMMDPDRQHSFQDFQHLVGAVDNCEIACSSIIAPAKVLNSQLDELDATATGQGGLKTQQVFDIATLLKKLCSQYEINFGVPIGNARLTGSITEVSGLDLNGNTAAFVVALINLLNS
ncbi:hypothetical protein ACFLZ1_04295 [Patescibacteria group bacterium]